MSSYRLFRVCTTGPYSDLFSRFVDGLHDLPFEDSMQRCRENGFLYPGGLRASLEKLGVEVMEVLVDVPQLQLKWLAEAGETVPPMEGFDKVETFFTQLASFRPDIVYFQTFFALPPEVRKQVKQRCPGVRLVVGHRGFPLMDCAEYEDVDAVFLAYPRFHEKWHAVGVKTFFHLHCFDEMLLPAIRQGLESRPIYDFTFVGTTGWGFIPHDGRYYDLRRMLDRTSLMVWGMEPISGIPGSPWSLRKTLATFRPYVREGALEILGSMPEIILKSLRRIGEYTHPRLQQAASAAMRRKREENLKPLSQFGKESRRAYWFHHEKPIRELYPNRVHRPVFGLEYLRLLASSRVTWNRHLEMEGAGANMRLFEACGAGTCQLVDYRPEVVEVFEPEKEVVVYRSLEDCIDKVRYLLNHEDERRGIAEAGQQRALRDHSTTKRACELHGHLLTLL